MGDGNSNEIYDKIIKSQEDKRHYRGIRFGNGLKTLLVSDPETDKSSAALDVNIGAMCDPAELPGLAHFCEHMLFLGTEKYTTENEYSKFLSEHAGGSNAYTSKEHTNYYFYVAPENLGGALDRFAQFFLAPLFTESATEREVNAVDSEHSKNIQSDVWRLNQLERSTGDPKHDYSKFSTGNKETLLTIPRSKGVDTRAELLKFHEKYYSSNIMGLVVLGKESLDELQSMVEPLFAGIKNKNVVPPEWQDHPHSDAYLRKRAAVIPVKDIRSLALSWPIPDLHPYYKSNPGHYVSHLVGHEGPGSLLSELKRRGWVNTLSSGPRAGAKGFMFFTVNVDLSEEGQDHVDDIVELVFQYINMLREAGPQQWIHDECNDLSKMIFRFKDKERPEGYTSSLASLLHEYPVDEVLCGGYHYDEYRPDLINMLLEKLSPDKVRVGMVSKAFEGKTDLEEPWYGTKYSFEDVSNDVLTRWRNAGTSEMFKLPGRNEFIPTDFSIVSREKNPNDVPVPIKDTELMRVWFAQDNKFLLPKMYLDFEISSPAAYTDPLNHALNYLFVALFTDALNEYAYDAELACLQYSLIETTYGLQLKVGGYSHKQHVLLEKIMDKMTNFNIDPKRFDILKEKYERSLRNFSAEQPYQHAVYYLTVLTSEQYWTVDEMLDALADATLERLQAFLPCLLSKLHIEALVYGNVDRQRALELCGIVERALVEKRGTKPQLPSQRRKYREYVIPDRSYFVYKRNNHVHPSSSVEVYYQCDVEDTRNNVLLELFCQIVNEPCFDVLRTKEQLGYIVFSGVRRSACVQGLRVIVQSARHPAFVETRIEAFLTHVQEVLAAMTEEEFATHVTALCTRRLEKPKQMRAQNQRFWGEIISQLYNYRRDEIEVAALREIKKSDIQAFFDDLLVDGAPRRHKVVVHIVGTEVEEKGTSTEAELTTDTQTQACLTEPVEITDVNEFKRRLGLFPLPKPSINLSKSKL